MKLETLFTQLIYQHDAKRISTHSTFHGVAYTFSWSENFTLEVCTDNSRTYSTQQLMDKISEQQVKIRSINITQLV